MGQYSRSLFSLSTLPLATPSRRLSTRFFYLTNTLNRKQKRSACPQRGNIYWKLSLNSWNIKCIFGGKILPLVLVSRQRIALPIVNWSAMVMKPVRLLSYMFLQT